MKNLLYISSFNIFLIILVLVGVLFFVCKFILSRKTLHYEYNNHKIIVYSGVSNYYIKVDGEIKDYFKKFSSSIPINLKCNLDNEELRVHIVKGYFFPLIITSVGKDQIFPIEQK